MANGVTAFAGGFGEVPAAPPGAEYAERALGLLLVDGGTMEGETLIDELKRLGYSSRGPAYYPGGPFYELGSPHTYAAINPNGQAWDLIHNGVPYPNPWMATPGGQLPAAPPIPPQPPIPPGLRAILLDMADACYRLARGFNALASLIP